jgi:hypothetical protein
MFNPNANPDFERGPRRASDAAIEKASDAHVARMRARLAKGQPHAPTIKVTVWKRTRPDSHGNTSWYPKVEKRVQFDDGTMDVGNPAPAGSPFAKKSKATTTPQHDEKLAQAVSLSEPDNRESPVLMF